MEHRISGDSSRAETTISRRAVLAGLWPSVGVVLSGCGDVRPDGTPTPTATDAGSESYGIVLENNLAGPEAVTVEVKKPFDEGTIWEQSATIPTDSNVTWSNVVTGEEEQVVLARFGGPDGIPPEYMNGELEKKFRRDQLWVTPGSESAPDVTNFRVVLRSVNIQMDFTVKTISITYPGGPPTATPCEEIGCGPG